VKLEKEAGQNTTVKSFTKYYWDDQIKEDEMGGACSAHGHEKCVQNFVGKPEGNTLEDIGVDGRVILKCILTK
jgi:hypothetical protein